jgi:hypothetical protein
VRSLTDVDQCRILIPLNRAIRYHLPQAELKAIRWSQRTGKESGFYYNTETRRPISPIFRGHCKSLDLPDASGPRGQRGDFHTHPNVGNCQFSGTDLVSSFNQHESEMTLACLGPEVEESNAFDESIKIYHWQHVNKESVLIERIPLWLVSPLELHRYGDRMSHWNDKHHEYIHTLKEKKPILSESHQHQLRSKAEKASDREDDIESAFMTMVMNREAYWRISKQDSEIHAAIKSAYPNAYKVHTPHVPEVIKMFQRWEKE